MHGVTRCDIADMYNFYEYLYARQYKFDDTDILIVKATLVRYIVDLRKIIVEIFLLLAVKCLG